MTKILVIEDEASVLDNIIDTLEAEGFDVIGESNGRDGLLSAIEHMPDLTICDVNMPEMDGYEVLYRIRNSNKTKTLSFIFLTALSEREDLRRGMELGADDFITKPFTNDELVAAVETQLNKLGAVRDKMETSLSKLRKNIVYSLPHELRTPLMQIMGFADLLRVTDSPMSIEEIQSFGEAIWDGSKRLNRLIENYLVYAQLEVVANDLEQVKRLRNNITPSTRAIIEERAYAVASNYDRVNDLSIKIVDQALAISPENFGKCIEELVDNAFKFSKRGELIEVKGRKSDGEFTICVLDRGVGMATDQPNEIGAYMQFDRALQEQQGVGLGLIIAKKITELHGGTINIKSKQDRGTLVCIRFPV